MKIINIFYNRITKHDITYEKIIINLKIKKKLNIWNTF